MFGWPSCGIICATFALLDRFTTFSSTHAAQTTRNAEVELCRVEWGCSACSEICAWATFMPNPLYNVSSARSWQDSQPLAAHRLHKLQETPEVEQFRVERACTTCTLITFETKQLRKLCDSGKMHNLTQHTINSCTNFHECSRLNYVR